MGSDDIRIGDVERELALDALREHVSLGRLTPDEYHERMQQALVARTRGDLEILTSDLPVLRARDHRRAERIRKAELKAERLRVRRALRAAGTQMSIDIMSGISRATRRLSGNAPGPSEMEALRARVAELEVRVAELERRLHG